MEELLMDAEGLVAKDEHGGATRREAAHLLGVRLRVSVCVSVSVSVRVRVRVRVRVTVTVRVKVRVRVRVRARVRASVRTRVRLKVRARGREAARHLHDLGLRGLADGDHVDAALPQPAGAEPP